MEFFDIIIIGAGPAGLKCAETLGDSKNKVLLLEKNNEIGPKVCAGGLTGKDIKYLNLPKDLIEFSYSKIKMHVNENDFIVNDKDNFVYTVDRKKLGQWQLSKLKNYDNIEIRTNAKVSKIEKKYITVNNKQIFYNFLVGADGSSSIVKRYLGIKTSEVDIAIQYIIPTTKYKEFELFFNSKLFSAWYAWIFPHKNYVSIGCGANHKFLSSNKLKQNFSAWLNDNKIDISSGKYEAFMIDYGYRGHKFNNIFLIGDAAGFASGLTGEGIYQAFISGEEIAKMILNKNYKSKKIDNLLKVKNIHNKITHLLIYSGYFRTIIFYILIILFKIPFFKNRILNLLA